MAQEKGITPQPAVAQDVDPAMLKELDLLEKMEVLKMMNKLKMLKDYKVPKDAKATGGKK